MPTAAVILFAVLVPTVLWLVVREMWQEEDAEAGADLQANLAARVAQLEQEVAQLRRAQETTPVSEVLQAIQDMAAPEEPASVVADDLQEIYGIGPVIEEALNELGIMTFEQLAELDDAALETLAAQMRPFKGQVQRDDWAGQARELLAA